MLAFYKVGCAECTKRLTVNMYVVTVLNGDIFVVSDTSTVHVYDSNSYTSTCNIWIPESQILQAIVSCSHYNCLYATDPRKKTIYRWDISNSASTKWSVEGDCERLSVTNDYNLLVILSDTNRIQEYTTRGSAKRNQA